MFLLVHSEALLILLLVQMAIAPAACLHFVASLFYLTAGIYLVVKIDSGNFPSNTGESIPTPGALQHRSEHCGLMLTFDASLQDGVTLLSCAGFCGSSQDAVSRAVSAKVIVRLAAQEEVEGASHTVEMVRCRCNQATYWAGGIR